MSLLKDLKPTITRKPYRMIIYGRAGLGKSTFASEAPFPLFADIENGCNQIVTTKLPCEQDAAGRDKDWTWTYFKHCLVQIYKEDHEFKTFVIDSLDWLIQLMIDHVLEEYNANKSKEDHATSLQNAGNFGHGTLLLVKEVNYLIHALGSIQKKHKMNIIFTAHEHSSGNVEQDLVHGDYVRYNMKTESKKASAIVTEWCDYVFRAAQDVKVKVDGPRSRGAKAKAEYKDRVLYTRDMGLMHAKRRVDLPDVMELSYKAFQKAEDAAYEVLAKQAQQKFSDERMKPEDLIEPPVVVQFEKASGYGDPVSFN